VTELTVQLHPSRQLAVFIVAVHLLAAMAVWFSALPWWASLPMTAIVLLHLRHSLQGFRSAGRELHCQEGRWSLGDRSGEQPLHPLGEWLVTSWLIVLQFKRADGSRINLVLPPDSAPPDELRRLRVFLRFSLAG
jgi:hypothetical protein